MTEKETKEKKAEYDRRYRKTHREALKKRDREYHIAHKEVLNTRRREYFRAHALKTTLNGREITVEGLQKRPRPNECEICGRTEPEIKILQYHHWDDGNLSMGIWVCYFCHMAVTCYEKGWTDRYLTRYLAKKSEIEKSEAKEHV